MPKIDWHARWAAIKANPAATQEEVLSLKPQDRIRHPNCPPEQWWEWVQTMPILCMQSPSFALFTLEDPGRWDKMERDNIDQWIKEFTSNCAWETNELFAADCIEHVLWIYETQVPNDSRPRQTMEARRRYAQGNLSEANWQAARLLASSAYQETDKPGADNVADAAAKEWLGSILHECCAAAACYQEAQAGDGARWDEDHYQEQRWEWYRLVQRIETGQ